MTSEPDPPWFRQQMLGRIEPVHWKGFLHLVALVIVLLAGMVLDDVGRRWGAAIHAGIMIVLGFLALGLAWRIAGKTQR